MGPELITELLGSHTVRTVPRWRRELTHRLRFTYYQARPSSKSPSRSSSVPARKQPGGDDIDSPTIPDERTET